VRDVKQSLERSHAVDEVAEVGHVAVHRGLQDKEAVLAGRFDPRAAALGCPSDQEVGSRLDDGGKPFARRGLDQKVA
jgi:hypothetical protein